VEIPGLRVAQYFTVEVHRMLNLVVVVRLPSFNYNCCTDHIACSRYVRLQNFMGLGSHEGGWGNQVPFEFFEGPLRLFGPLELTLLFEELEEWEPPDTESRDESS
jgi:hypothetical protein